MRQNAGRFSKRFRAVLLASCISLMYWTQFLISKCHCFQSKLLIRQIQSHPKNVTHALGILNQVDNDVYSKSRAEFEKYHEITKGSNKKVGRQQKEFWNLVVAVLRVCGNANEPKLALEIYQRYPSEPARAMTISVLGSCQKLQEAVDLLDNDFPPPSAASFNAAIAACGKAKDWKMALDIYQNKLPNDENRSLLTTNALLTVLSKSRKGREALGILESMVPMKSNSPGSPGCDSVTYTLVISALVRSNMLHEASKLLKDLVENKRQHQCSAKSIEAMNDLVLSAFSQRADWSGVESIERLRLQQRANMMQGEKANDSATTTESSSIIQSEYRFHKWEGLKKIGKGKESYWEIATYQNTINDLNITVGCRPHRNPSRNGIQLLFFDNHFNEERLEWKQRKIGFLLMKNSAEERNSSLLGMFLKPLERGRGISKVCLAIWIWLCLESSIRPVTGVINKPLLALILQHTFGFDGGAKRKGGVLVNLSQDPGNPNSVVLFPLSGKSLEGAFSPWDLEHQNIQITSRQPPVRGRVVRIGSKLYPPSDESSLKSICDEILKTEYWKCDLPPNQLQLMLLGKGLSND